MANAITRALQETEADTSPTSGLGPKMQALTDKQQKFVIALCETGGRDHTLAAKMAGYSTFSQNSLRVSAHTTAHTPKVLEAIREEAERRLRSSAILGASVLAEIAGDPLHKDRFKAADKLLDRAGLLTITEHRHVYVDGTDAGMIERITELCRVLKLDAKQLLGSAAPAMKALPAPAVDVEFTEVRSTEGLEDIL